MLFCMRNRLGICRETVKKYRHSESMQGTSHYTIRGSIDRHNSLSQKAQQDVINEAQKMLKNDDDYV